MYLGSSGKLGRQLKWASDQGARWALIYGRQEEEAGLVTVRDMDSGAQAAVPVSELSGYLAEQATAASAHDAAARDSAAQDSAPRDTAAGDTPAQDSAG